MENNSIKIESDGTVEGTRVYGPDGEEIHGIQSIDIDLIDADDMGSMVGATITFLTPEIMVECLPDGIEPEDLSLDAREVGDGNPE